MVVQSLLHGTTRVRRHEAKASNPQLKSETYVQPPWLDQNLVHTVKKKLTIRSARKNTACN